MSRDRRPKRNRAESALRGISNSFRLREVRQAPQLPWARPFSLMMGVRKRAFSGVFMEENAHRSRSPCLHLQGKWSKPSASTFHGRQGRRDGVTDSWHRLSGAPGLESNGRSGQAGALCESLGRRWTGGAGREAQGWCRTRRASVRRVEEQA